MENQEVQEEIMVLKSIFGDKVEVKSNPIGGTEVMYGYEPNLITLTIGGSYPNELPIITVPIHLQALGLQAHLITVATPLTGTPVLYAILDAAKDWMKENETSVQKASQKKENICKYFLQGKCRFGVHCISLHPGASLQPETQTSTQPEPHAVIPSFKTKQKEPKIDTSPSKKTSKSNSKHAEKEEEDTKKERMRTATEVISRILWDPDLPADQFSVGYLDRFVGIQEKAFKEFSWEDISSVGADVLAVPKHRIQYFKYKGTIVWDKRSQTDDFFGSRGGKTIDQIVDKPEPTTTDTGVCKNGTENKEDVDEVDLIDNEDEDQPLAHGHSNQDRPTHFVCIRITDEQVKASVGEIVSHVTRLNPQLAEGIIKTPAIHITLCMVRLPNDEQIELAKQVFESCRLQFIKLLPRCVKLEFTGVDNFRGRLIYIKVKPLPGLDRFVFHVIEQLQLAGLRTPGNHKEYTPHITLIKLSRPMQKEMNMKLIDPSCYQPYLAKNLGCQAVTSVHLCSMHAPAQSDGFYLRYATITNCLLGLPDSFVVLVERKLVQLKEKGYLGEIECDSLLSELHQSVSQRQETKFDKVIEELVQTNKEARTFESSGTSSTRVMIMRGLPGSGKSHLLTHSLEAMSDPSQVAVISADAFLTEDSDYKFSPATVFKAHLWCIGQFLDALCNEKSLIAVDNTNSQEWEYHIYTYLCEVLGLACHVLEIPCPSPALAERFRCRNQHKIQPPVITRMLERWEEDTRAVFVPPTLAYPRDWSQVQALPYSLLNLCERRLAPLPESIRASKSLVAVYTGVFLTTKSQWELLSTFQPSHNNIHASHITLSFEPGMSNLQKLPIGKKVKISVVGHAENSKVQVCVVELPHRLTCDNKTPHITITTVEGVSPKTANTMLQNQIVHRCDNKVLKGTVGVVVRQAMEEEKEGKEPPGEKLASMASYVVTSISDLQAILPRLLIMSESEVSSNALKEDPPAILTGDQKTTKLFVFDFDGTLTIPPGPVEGKRLFEYETGRKWPHKGWLGWPESLLPPMRVLPGPALAEFRNHINRAGSYTVVLTGRVENTKLGLMKVLENFQVFPDKVYFKPDITDESTADFKLRTVKQLLTVDFPDVTLVKFWDDMPENLWAINWLSQNATVSHVQFDIIDATKMSSTLAVTKHGKKMSVKKTDIHAIRIQYVSSLQKHLAVYGFLPTTEYKMAAQEGIEFIANQFSTVIGYQGDPLNLLYVFGSYPIQRVSDVDMCLIAPNTQTQIEWIDKMASQLQSCGVKQVHVGHSSRCPRLKVNLMFLESSSVEYDMVVVLIPNMDLFNNPPIEKIPATELVKMKKPGDNVTKVALSGPLFMSRIEDVLQSKGVSHETFGAIVEMIVQILIVKREKGNAYHCIRTFHIVQLLIEFIQQDPGSMSSSNIDCDDLFRGFIDHISEMEYEKWEKLFGEFVPNAYIPRVMAIFKECSQLLKPSEQPSEEYYEELLKRTEYPPSQNIPVDIKISGRSPVLKWKAGIIVEARLPSYIRQLISHGLDIRPDGNVRNSCKYSFSVPPLKSAKDILQQILRPFWGELSELRKQEGLNIQLNFGQPTAPADSVSPALEILTANASKDPKSSALLEQVTNFASSSAEDSLKELHLPTTLTAHARLLVHEAAERLGLQHSSLGSGKNRHVVLKKT